MDTGAQLQTLPYPMVLKLFLYSNAFMAKSGAQGLTFKSVTNEQTDKQADRQKLTVLATPAAGEIRPLQTWHCDRGPRARPCTSKTIWGFDA